MADQVHQSSDSNVETYVHLPGPLNARRAADEDERLLKGFEQNLPLKSEEEDVEVHPSPDGLCSACGKEAAMRCNGCVDAPSLASTSVKIIGAWYCSKGCQKRHWPAHKPICKKLKQRIQLWHTAEFLKKLWLFYMTFAWPPYITSATLKGGYLIMVDASLYEHLRDRALSHFPEALTMSDQATTDAIKTYGTCEEALVWLRPLLEKMLANQCTRIETIRAVTHNHAITPLLVNEVGAKIADSEVNHAVFRMTMASGEKFIFDPTASQFGHKDSVVHWGTWRAQRASEPKTVEPFATFDDLIEDPFHDGDKFRLCEYYELCEKKLVALGLFGMMQEWFEGGRQPIPCVPKIHDLFSTGSRQDYIRRAGLIIDRLEASMPLIMEKVITPRIEKVRKEGLAIFMRTKGFINPSAKTMKAYEMKAFGPDTPLMDPPVQARNVIYFPAHYLAYRIEPEQVIRERADEIDLGYIGIACDREIPKAIAMEFAGVLEHYKKTGELKKEIGTATKQWQTVNHSMGMNNGW